MALFSRTETGEDFWYGSGVLVSMGVAADDDVGYPAQHVDMSSGVSTPMVKESSTKDDSHSSSARSSHCHGTRKRGVLHEPSSTRSLNHRTTE